MNIERFDIYSRIIINQDIYHSCLNKKIGFNYERVRKKVTIPNYEIHNYHDKSIENKAVIEIKKHFEEKKKSNNTVIIKINEMPKHEIKNISIPFINENKNETIVHKNHTVSEFIIHTAIIKNKTIIHKNHSVSEFINLTAIIKNKTIVHKNHTVSEFINHTSIIKNKTVLEKPCPIQNVTNAPIDQTNKLKDFLLTEVSKNKSILLMENGKVEKIFYKNNSYMVLNDNSCSSVPKPKEFSNNETVKINLNLMDKHYLISNNKTFEKITKKVIVIDPKKNKDLFNKNNINITIKINELGLNYDHPANDEKIDLETFLKKKLKEINSLKIKNKKDVEFYEVLMNVIKYKLKPFIKNETIVSKVTLNNNNNLTHSENKNYYKQPSFNMTKLKINVKTNKNTHFTFNTSVDNTKNFSEILLDINITDHPQKPKIIIINNTINNCSNKPIKVVEEEKVFNVRNTSDINKVLFESQIYLNNFIQSFRFIQYVSGLFFNKEDMIDPVKELNNTIEDIYLDKEQKNSEEKNRKTFLRKGEISFIEKDEVKKNIDHLTKMNINKMNSIDDMFDVMILFISNKEIIKNNSSEMIKDNYEFLRTVIIDDVSFLKKYFEKFNENFLIKITENELSPRINNTVYLFFSKIKKFQQKYINFLKNSIDIEEESFIADKNRKESRLKTSNKLNKRVEKRIEINNFVDYKKEIGKYLLNIKTMKIIYKLFQKGMKKTHKIFNESYKYSKKINELDSLLQKQKTAFNKMLNFTQPKDLNSKIPLIPRKLLSNFIKRIIKTRILNNELNKSLNDSIVESEYVSKYNSTYVNLEMNKFTKEAINLSEADFFTQFKSKWNKLNSVMNKFLNHELENKLKVLSEVTNLNNVENFNFKKDLNKEQINSLFEYFDTSNLILDSETTSLISKYREKLSSTISTLDDFGSHNTNLGLETKIMEKIINEFKSTVNEYLNKNNLNKNEDDVLDGFADVRNNLNKNLLKDYLDNLNENLIDIKNISNEYSSIKENLSKLDILITNFLEKKYAMQDINNLKKKEDKTILELKTVTEQLEVLKNKTITEKQIKEINSDNTPIKLKIEKYNKLVKNSSSPISGKNITMNITYSKIHENEQKTGLDIKTLLISIILILLLTAIYISIFKKIISYSINYLVNSNLKLSLLNKSVIFWTLVTISLLSAILGKLLYTNWVFLFVFAIIGEFIAASLIFHEHAGMLFGCFSFSSFALISGLKLFLFTKNIFIYLALITIFTLALMTLGCLLGYIHIFLYEKEELGDFDNRGVRLGDNYVQTSNKTDESIINDGNE